MLRTLPFNLDMSRALNAGGGYQVIRQKVIHGALFIAAIKTTFAGYVELDIFENGKLIQEDIRVGLVSIARVTSLEFGPDLLGDVCLAIGRELKTERYSHGGISFFSGRERLRCVLSFSLTPNTPVTEIYFAREEEHLSAGSEDHSDANHAPIQPGSRISNASHASNATRISNASHGSGASATQNDGSASSSNEESIQGGSNGTGMIRNSKKDLIWIFCNGNNPGIRETGIVSHARQIIASGRMQSSTASPQPSPSAQHATPNSTNAGQSQDTPAANSSTAARRPSPVFANPNSNYYNSNNTTPSTTSYVAHFRFACLEQAVTDGFPIPKHAEFKATLLEVPPFDSFTGYGAPSEAAMKKAMGSHGKAGGGGTANPLGGGSNGLPGPDGVNKRSSASSATAKLLGSGTDKDAYRFVTSCKFLSMRADLDSLSGAGNTLVAGLLKRNLSQSPGGLPASSFSESGNGFGTGFADLTGSGFNGNGQNGHPGSHFSNNSHTPNGHPTVIPTTRRILICGQCPFLGLYEIRDKPKNESATVGAMVGNAASAVVGTAATAASAVVGSVGGFLWGALSAATTETPPASAASSGTAGGAGIATGTSNLAAPVKRSSGILGQLVDPNSMLGNALMGTGSAEGAQPGSGNGSAGAHSAQRQTFNPLRQRSLRAPAGMVQCEQILADSGARGKKLVLVRKLEDSTRKALGCAAVGREKTQISVDKILSIMKDNPNGNPTSNPYSNATHTVIAVADSLGRIGVYCAETLRLLNLWKGYRNAGVAFLGDSDTAVFFASRRGLLEVWNLRTRERLSAYNVGSTCKMVMCNFSAGGANAYLGGGAGGGGEDALGSSVMLLRPKRKDDGATAEVHFLDKQGADANKNGDDDDLSTTDESSEDDGGGGGGDVGVQGGAAANSSPGTEMNVEPNPNPETNSKNAPSPALSYDKDDPFRDLSDDDSDRAEAVRRFSAPPMRDAAEMIAGRPLWRMEDENEPEDEDNLNLNYHQLVNILSRYQPPSRDAGESGLVEIGMPPTQQAMPGVSGGATNSAPRRIWRPTEFRDLNLASTIAGSESAEPETGSPSTRSTLGSDGVSSPKQVVPTLEEICSDAGSNSPGGFSVAPIQDDMSPKKPALEGIHMSAESDNEDATPKKPSIEDNGSSAADSSTDEEYATKTAQAPSQITMEGSHEKEDESASSSKTLRSQRSMAAAKVYKHEKVFYDSAKSKRTCVGKCHYCIACPGWNKITDKRVVYSRWETMPLFSSKTAWVFVGGLLCCCVGGDGNDNDRLWTAEESKKIQEEMDASIKLPCGRQLDHFDADLITDMSAHQNLCQICRGEGDMIVTRLAGGDLSNSDPEWVMSDVSNLFQVFQAATFELAKSNNLKGAAQQGLGKRMGAVVWDWPAGGGGEPTRTVDYDREMIYYDSTKAKRTLFGYLCNADWCFKPVYKITSERVMYTDWDWWYLCDTPLASICLPFFMTRSIVEDLCCCGGQGSAKRLENARKNDVAKRASRGMCNKQLACPVGRTLTFFDMDIVVDIGAHQRCAQLMVNEGDLILHRLPGGDPDNPKQAFVVRDMEEVFQKFDDLSYTPEFDSHLHPVSEVRDMRGVFQKFDDFKTFKVRDMPEVFQKFDDLSYTLSMMDLKHFRANKMGMDMKYS